MYSKVYVLVLKAWCNCNLPKHLIKNRLILVAIQLSSLVYVEYK